MTNYFRKSKSLYSSTSNSFSTGEGETITPTSVVGLPTDTELVLTFDRVDGSGTATPTKMERIKGTISGGNFVVASGGRGYDGSTEQAHTSPVVEMVVNAADQSDLVTGLLVEHNQTGTHKTALVTTLKASSAEITTGTEDAKIVTPKALKDAGIVSTAATTDGWSPTSVGLTYKSVDAPTYVCDTASDLTTVIGVGMRIKLTHGGATKYFIITAIDATTITLYGGTDYTLAATAITNVYFSPHKAPLGFPVDPNKWSIEVENTTQTNQSATDGTWYNIGTIKIDVPIGVWNLGYWSPVEGRHGSSVTMRYVRTTLSTANNSESDITFTSVLGQAGASGNQEASGIQTKQATIALATKATYYLNHAGVGTVSITVNCAADTTAPSTVLRAVNAYL